MPNLVEDTQDIDSSKPLQINHERFLANYMACGNGTQAYLTIYKCSTDAARSSAATLLANPNVKGRLQWLLDNVTVSPERAAMKLGQRLESQRAVVVPAGGAVQFVDDNQAQISAATTVLKLHGKIKDGGISVTNQTNHFNAFIGTQASSRIDKLVDTLDKLRGARLLDVEPIATQSATHEAEVIPVQ